jgi:hypothetical protein
MTIGPVRVKLTGRFGDGLGGRVETKVGPGRDAFGDALGEALGDAMPLGCPPPQAATPTTMARPPSHSRTH